jgi:hypothetical protein
VAANLDVRCGVVDQGSHGLILSQEMTSSKVALEIKKNVAADPIRARLEFQTKADNFHTDSPRDKSFAQHLQSICKHGPNYGSASV